VSVLALGQAFGRVPQRWTADSIALSPVVHDQKRVNVAHAHEAAFVTLMLDGDYTEKAALRSFRFERFSAMFHPAGIEHQDFIGASGVRLLMFEFTSELIEDMRNRSLRDLSGSRAAWDLLALYRDAPHIEQLEFESRALELIGRIAPLARTTPRDLPSLQRAREYLHARFRDRLMIKDIARAAGVHPVYLGQVFRRQFGETIGAYVNRLRIRAAADQLSSTDAPLADVAFEYGFCDQSHFQRVFKRLSGRTPTEFRKNSEALRSVALL